MLLLWKGILLGLSIAAPVGPIGVLCIRRTLTQGRRMGLATGLGAACADMLYGFAAAFGIAAISGFLLDHVGWFQAIGGLFLLVLGYRTFRSKPVVVADKEGRERLLPAFIQTLFLTLTNPMTILSFAAMFARIGLTGDRLARAEATTMVLGVFMGSMLWWVMLCMIIGSMRRFLSPSVMIGINRLSGLIVVLFGLAALYSLFFL